MTECFLPPSSSPAEQRRAEHPGGVARTPSSEEISPTKFPGLYRTGEPSPPHDGHHHEPPDAYVSDDDKEHSKKKNKFKKKEKRSKMLFLGNMDWGREGQYSTSELFEIAGLFLTLKIALWKSFLAPGDLNMYTCVEKKPVFLDVEIW